MLFTGAGGGRADVGQHDQVGCVQQRVVGRQRLGVGDVERGGRDLAVDAGRRAARRWSTIGPRAVLTRIAVGFIAPGPARRSVPVVCGVSGQCSETTSASASSSSSAHAARAAALDDLHARSPRRARATARPIRPSPTMPSTAPSSSRPRWAAGLPGRPVAVAHGGDAPRAGGARRRGSARTSGRRSRRSARPACCRPGSRGARTPRRRCCRRRRRSWRPRAPRAGVEQLVVDAVGDQRQQGVGLAGVGDQLVARRRRAARPHVDARGPRRAGARAPDRAASRVTKIRATRAAYSGVVTAIGLLHPGDMGAAVGAVLVGAGHDVAWVVRRALGRDRDAGAARPGCATPRTVGALAGEAEVIVSLCPPHAALDTARAVAAHRVHRRVRRRQRDRARDGGHGRRARDRRRRTRRRWRRDRPATARGRDDAPVPVGRRAPEIAATVRRHDARGAGRRRRSRPRRSALKMHYAAWTKGTTALLMAIRAGARGAGVEDALLAEWARSLARSRGPVAARRRLRGRQGLALDGRDGGDRGDARRARASRTDFTARRPRSTRRCPATPVPPAATRWMW